MQLLRFGTLIIAFVFVGSAFGQNEPTPVNTVQSFFAYVNAGKIESAIELIDGGVLVVDSELFTREGKKSVSSALKSFEVSGFVFLKEVFTEVNEKQANVMAQFVVGESAKQIDMFRIYLVKRERWMIKGWVRLTGDIPGHRRLPRVVPIGMPPIIDCPRCG